jgi:transcription termination factor Rho
MYDILELNKKLVPELREIAKELKIKRVESYKKQDLVYKILDTQAIQEAEKKEQNPSGKNQNKEEKSIKNILRKKPENKDEKDLQQQDNQRGKRPRRERVDPVIKHEKVAHAKKKQEKKDPVVQSRQEQIKAIIKGFSREKDPSGETEQKEAEKPQPRQINAEEKKNEVKLQKEINREEPQKQPQKTNEAKSKSQDQSKQQKPEYKQNNNYHNNGNNYQYRRPGNTAGWLRVPALVRL